ncbi:LysR family transcriptional regulator [Sphingomonas sp.]|uniref:LysR family transcriptional regulator n=1 Tax=Sphingomonas sp. TaxID=28214 RepID=UPI003D6D3A6E
MKLDLRRAATFHAVARAGGITAAARAEGRSPPAVHAELRRFERDAGVVLTERVGRRLRLTPEGRSIYAAIDSALAEIARATESVLSGVPAELPLRLGCVTAFGRYRLAPLLLGSIEKTRPVRLHTDSHDQLLAKLSGGQLDFALTYRSVVSAPIESRVIATEMLWLVGDLPEDLSPAALSRFPCSVYEEHEYVFARWFDGAFGRQPKALLPLDRTNELEEALLSVRAGRGFTIAPKEACLAHGLHPQGPEVPNDIILCAVGGRLLSEDAKWLTKLAGQ